MELVPLSIFIAGIGAILLLVIAKEYSKKNKISRINKIIALISTGLLITGILLIIGILALAVDLIL